MTNIDTDAGPGTGGRLSASAAAAPEDRTWFWSAAGIAAALAGFGVAEIVGVVAGAGSTPLIAVAQAFIDLTPPWLKDFAVSTFGTHDKAALLTGVGVVVAALAGASGLLARARPRAAAALVVLLGAVAAAAAVTRPDAAGLAFLPALAGSLTGLGVLLRIRTAALAAGGPSGSGPRRRQVLLATGAAAAGGVLAGVTGRWLTSAARGAEASRASIGLPAPAGGTPVLPADVEVAVAGMTPFRVPNPDFYRIDTATLVPQLSAANWRLRIHGMVEREITLDYPTLLSGHLIERDVTLTCVSNEVGGKLIGNARWLGLPLGPLLGQARPRAGADMVLSTSADGWTAGTPLGVLTDGRDALLAVAMNGVPLPIEHGFPVRMVVPGLYGYVSATKWVVDLEVTRFDRAQGYWTPRGWSALGPVKTQSRIDVPRPGAQVRAGQVAVAGVAWAQHRGIRAVEVRVDDGPWQAARLAAEASTDCWRQWVYRWNATPGRHTLAVRATDGTGAVQTGTRSAPAPDGATGWHMIDAEVS